ncbi:hypothetical protein ABK040_011517 [Willaertia magna]
MSSGDFRFVRNAEAWKQRCFHEDRASLNFIKTYVLNNNSPNQYSFKGPNNVPPGYKPRALPHMLSPIQDDNMSVKTGSSSVKTWKTGITDKTNRSTKSTVTVKLDEESKKKIERLERSLDEERKGRLEVQQELESLKEILKENLKKR